MLYPVVCTIRQLSEAETRSLLETLGERCTTLLSDASALPVRSAPEVVVLLSAMSRALSGVGEVAPEDAGRLRDTVHRLLIASPPAVSYAAAAVLGQLAAVEGGSAAMLMSEYLSLVTLQTASLGSQSGSRQGAMYPLMPASDGAPRPHSPCGLLFRHGRTLRLEATAVRMQAAGARGKMRCGSCRAAYWPRARSWAR